jgi:NAD-dependent dihydropyrimidine dehydrogenase PreA subunit
MRKTIVLALVIVLPIVGAFAGWFSAPTLARTHYSVQLADAVRAELAQPERPDSDEYESFVKQRAHADEVYAEADAIVATFRIGGIILGVWTGLVFSIAIFGFHRTRKRTIYEIDYEMCVACTRCFLSCPRERARRAEGIDTSSGDPS